MESDPFPKKQDERIPLPFIVMRKLPCDLTRRVNHEQTIEDVLDEVGTVDVSRLERMCRQKVTTARDDERIARRLDVTELLLELAHEPSRLRRRPVPLQLTRHRLD